MNELAGKTVLITRAEHQADGWTEKLTRAGACVVHVPLIEIAPPSDEYRALDEALARLSTYEGIIFTSSNAVDALFDRLNDCACSAFSWCATIAAVGPSSARALERRGINPTTVAEVPSAAGLLEMFEGMSVDGMRFLHPRARDGRDDIARGLSARGAEVDVVEAYCTTMPTNVDREAFIKLVDAGAIDIALFASPSVVDHFAKLVGEMRAREFSQRRAVAAIGPTTSITLQRYEMRIDADLGREFQATLFLRSFPA